MIYTGLCFYLVPPKKFRRMPLLSLVPNGSERQLEGIADRESDSEYFLE